jgi:hypothetical protein
MPVVRVEQFQETFVIHFGGDAPRINAYTLATTLVNIADAARAANFAINPGYDIEVVVEALGSGSFKAKLRALYRGASNLFSNQALQALVLGVISNFIYTHTLAPDAEVKVSVTAEEVVVEQGETKIVVPRAVHEATKLAEAQPQFVAAVREAVRVVETDSNVTSIGFSSDMQDQPVVRIPRERFATLVAPPTEVAVDDARDITEEADLDILRAILERSKRRWEFVRAGTRIAAPVTDEKFYNDFFAHDIKIAPGDRLRVKLKIRQRRVPGIGIFINDSYEVIEVFEHIPQPQQGKLSS